MYPAPIKWLFPGRFIFPQPLSLRSLSLLSLLCFILKNSLPKKQFTSSCLLLFSWSNPGPDLPSFPSPSLFDHLSVHLSFISVSSRSPVGAEGWQACVCPALLSAFLMSLKHSGSAYYGDEEIQAGQKVMVLANRRSFPMPLPLTSPLLFTPLLCLACPAWSEEKGSKC